MSRPIAVLLQGNHADLHASLRALELAQRTKGEMFVIAPSTVDGPEGDVKMRSLRELQNQLAWLGDIEEVKIHSHLLATSENMEELIDFILNARIGCLVLGAADHDTSRELKHWAAQLRRKIFSKKRWYFKSFWTIIAEPGDQTFKQTLDRLRRYRYHSIGTC